ncbi:hypothetical protein CLOSYM_04184 [[Clostridium] symbiosum ATCC 14940]|uniref:Uncharacterized protein n=1 Tax=[Clostridium] symbiosum ATCC 14940 TaxID=411472 RepID=A0ABC9TSI3_CLOSY|nr:hypothetical protein CLOSYM_04184 [[Clostridium] symbiosum ATCC 14940]
MLLTYLYNVSNRGSFSYKPEAVTLSMQIPSLPLQISSNR